MAFELRRQDQCVAESAHGFLSLNLDCHAHSRVVEALFSEFHAGGDNHAARKRGFEQFVRPEACGSARAELEGVGYPGMVSGCVLCLPPRSQCLSLDGHDHILALVGSSLWPRSHWRLSTQPTAVQREPASRFPPSCMRRQRSLTAWQLLTAMHVRPAR